MIGMVVLCAVPAITLAAPGDPCQRLGQSIETSLKLIGKDMVASVNDDSAPRETNRQLRYANELAQVAINLQLMTQNKCAQRKEPIDSTTYYGAAMLCYKANEKWRLTDYSSRGPAPSECDMEQWKPGVMVPSK